MTRRMYDAVDANNIPADASLVAGYAGGGSYVWSDADWKRFPNALLVRIVIDPSINDGHVLDVEEGNWEPPSAPAWAQMRRKAGVPPTIYTMRSWWQWCRDEFDKQGVPQPSYWIADWDGDDTLPDGMVAKQYANGDMSGGGCDLNVVADHWPGVDRKVIMSARDVWTQEIETPQWAQDQGVFEEGEKHHAATYIRNSHAHAKDARARIIEDVMPRLSDIVDEIEALAEKVDKLADTEIDAETTKAAIRDAIKSEIKATGDIKIKAGE